MDELTEAAVERAANVIADYLSDTGISDAHRLAARAALRAALGPSVADLLDSLEADAHAAGVAETLGRVRDGLTRGMHLHHDGEHWVSLPYVLDLLDAALAGTSGARSSEPLPVDQRDDRQSPQGEAPCACQSAEVRELVGPCDTSPQGEGERLPDDAPWPREECGDRGPRIGEDVTRCRRSKGHRMPHRTAPSDGHGNVEWSDLADPYDYRDDATAIGDSTGVGDPVPRSD